MPKKPANPHPPAPEPRPNRSRTPLVIAAIVVVALIATYVATRSVAPQPDQQAAATSGQPAAPPAGEASGQPAASVQPASGPLKLPDATPAAEEVPAAARFGPHKQDTYPPLPETGFPPPRPAETVRAVYQFAAEHPEVLSYIPCYCGCDRQGHKGNDDCFVAQRNAQGDVQAWDAHGMT